ncbi:pentatricopeptide repeat-containing protein chloroplastic-like [Gossypium australe]|uniref:Pentatricopeptide repeat-containing protein chloroplastic-like n=1 Tax=Gossypium australe TaxID=47621 RepID=A0A5B6WDA8_9ROSI|nr:pentatricopeptide repeat-containing protein chloroplastic-like [Gossypium australe]
MAKNNPLPPEVAENHAPRTMYDYAKPNLTGTESSIVRPVIAANNLELKPNTIQMIPQFVQFDSLQDEDPNNHLANFLEFCDTFRINGVSDDAISDSGTLNNKTPEAVYEFIEEMSLNNYQWQVMRTKPTKAASVFNLDAVAMLSNQVELLNKKVDGLCGSLQEHPVMQCDTNG